MTNDTADNRHAAQIDSAARRDAKGRNGRKGSAKRAASKSSRRAGKAACAAY